MDTTTTAEPVVDHDMAASEGVESGVAAEGVESGVAAEGVESGVAAEGVESGVGVGPGTSVVSPPGSAAALAQQKAAIPEPYVAQEPVLRMD